jgi:hypothetical protein
MTRCRCNFVSRLSDIKENAQDIAKQLQTFITDLNRIIAVAETTTPIEEVSSDVVKLSGLAKDIKTGIEIINDECELIPTEMLLLIRKRDNAQKEKKQETTTQTIQPTERKIVVSNLTGTTAIIDADSYTDCTFADFVEEMTAKLGMKKIQETERYVITINGERYDQQNMPVVTKKFIDLMVGKKIYLYNKLN